MTSDRQAPWWLQPGTESCPFCEASYAFEAGYYCVDCDQPVCPICIIEAHASREIYCPQCRPQEAR